MREDWRQQKKRVGELECGSKKKCNLKNVEKKLRLKKNEKSLNGLWNNIKNFIICVTRVPK